MTKLRARYDLWRWRRYRRKHPIPWSQQYDSHIAFDKLVHAWLNEDSPALPDLILAYLHPVISTPQRAGGPL